MEDKVVALVITMYDSTLILISNREVLAVPFGKEIESWDFSNFFV